MSDSYPPFASTYPGEPQREVWITLPKRRLWLHLLLFALTMFTTLAVGARLSYNYSHDLPAFDLENDLNPFSGISADPWRLLDGIPFSATLLSILLLHEMGHYLTCRHYGIAASYPYFIPAPTIIGTMGAFIRIKSRIGSRRALFDVGVSGPLAGFLLALPLLVVGLAKSKVTPDLLLNGSLNFGNPPLLLLLDSLFHPGVPALRIYMHPMARAAWVGLFATALNLLPVGQLDGGHILYAVDRRWHHVVSRLVVAALGLPMFLLAASWLLARWLPFSNQLATLIENNYWHGWFIWSAVLLILGTRHPPILDSVSLNRNRRGLAWAALAVFLLCFTPTPFLAS